jgi:membrane fusion protein (multidrug efflux system)
LLPPQNASGNWIKIVQRVPVRIALDPGQLRDHPLRVGLSVSVEADVRDQSGPLVTSRIGAGVTRANTGEDSGPAAEEMIARILRENGGAQR